MDKWPDFPSLGGRTFRHRLDRSFRHSVADLFAIKQSGAEDLVVVAPLLALEASGLQKE